jgi:mercuric ion binding protein
MTRSLIVAAGVVALSAVDILPTITISPANAQSAAVAVSKVQTATFDIKNMTCGLCPVAVKKAMEGVKGVQSVEIDFDTKTATAVFDPSVTTIEAISAASTNAGYPAAVNG